MPVLYESKRCCSISKTCQANVFSDIIPEGHNKHAQFLLTVVIFINLMDFRLTSLNKSEFLFLTLGAPSLVALEGLRKEKNHINKTI